ncbi:glycosyltransferase family 2 protein [Stutzerimonas sp.]|uniref:glycosyltransferase family 2 protein n=1 Tax=Stutzerimonas sp. TaxID=2901166 RepID=UPI0035B18AC8
MGIVSVITPSCNSGSFISDTIGSVLAQTFTNWEMIIVDDASVDNSVELIEGFAKLDGRIKLIRLSSNQGAAVSRNTALEMAQGRYIAFLDSDDLWLPDKLEKQLNFMQKNNFPFTYGAYEKINGQGRVFGHVGVPSRVRYSDLLKTCSIGCLTAMYDTEYFNKVAMPLIRKRQDLGLWLKLLKKVDYAYGLNEILGQYRVRCDSISANKASAAVYTWRLYREVENLSLLRASYYFSHYSVRGLLRTKAPALARVLGFLK